MDRNGKKPKATHDDPPHPERSDTKAQLREVAETHDADARVATEKADVDELRALESQGRKGTRP